MTTAALLVCARAGSCPGAAVFRPAVTESEGEPEEVTREPYGVFNTSGPWSFFVPRDARDVNVTFRWWLPNGSGVAPNSERLEFSADGDLPGDQLGSANLTVVCHGLPAGSAAHAEALVAALRRHRPGDALLEVLWNVGAACNAATPRTADIYYCPTRAGATDSAAYQQAAGDSRLVARALARTLTGLVFDHGYDLGRVHLLGFGVGAHVVGFVADELGHVAYGSHRLGRLTLLDPTAPLFVAKLGLSHLSAPGRARASDAVHTSAAEPCGLGVKARIAALDVYVNGGERQPHCRSSVRCSHVAALVYYKRTVERCAGDAQGTELLPGYWTPTRKGVELVSPKVCAPAGPRPTEEVEREKAAAAAAAAVTSAPSVFVLSLVSVVCMASVR